MLALARRGGLRELAAQACRWRGEALALAGERTAAAAALDEAEAAVRQLGRLRLELDVALARAKLATGGEHGARAEALARRLRDSLAGSELTACV
jgi:hypothetical protein